MSDKFTINNELIRLATALETASYEYTELCLDAAMKRDAYELAKAKAMVTATGSAADKRKAEITQICETQMTEAHIAEARREGMKERMRALSDVLNACQTRASFLRDEIKLTGQFT